MNTSFKKRNFDTIIKIVSYLIRFAVIGLYILLGLLLVGFVVVLFIPKASLNFDLANIEHINIYFMNVLYDISDGGLTGIINVKSLLALALSTGLLNLAFLQFIMIKLNGLMKDVKAEQPFSDGNVSRLMHIGFAYLAASVVLPWMGAWLFSVVGKTLNILEGNINLSINFEAVFMGALVLILAYVFNYGRNLQEDHDLTV